MLSVVIPAFNETHRLRPTLDRVIEFLEAEVPDYELIVVDDGSTDDTVALVKSYADRNSRVRVLALGVNRGKGAAVRDGMLAAMGDPILFSDADLATPIQEVHALQAALDDGHDIAIASRAVAGADVRVHQRRVRELAGRTFNLLVRLTSGTNIKDTQCGFKLFTRAAAHDLFSQATVDGFAFDVEVLLLARGRYRVAEVPVAWRHVEESKVSKLSGARAFVDMLTMRARLRLRGR